MPWTIHLNKESFNRIKDDKFLAEVICLARICNSLRFSMFGGMTHLDFQEPGQRRQLTSSFFVTASFLYEGFSVIDRLNKDFYDLTIFKNSLGLLLSNKKYKRFRKEVLYKVRNKVTFHSLNEIVPDVINRLNLEDYVFASRIDGTSKELYYELADLIAINYIIGDNGSDEEDEKRLYEIVDIISDLAYNFISSADKFINEYLGKNNCFFKKVSDI